MITGDRFRKGWKERHIQHPLLRFIHWAIATTIYGRVSTLFTCTTEDLILMDFMLRPKAVRLDFARLMVEHWISVRDQKEQSADRVQGAIAIGSLLTHLARSTSAPFDDNDIVSTKVLEINFEYLSSALMEKRGSTAATRDTYFWQLEDRPAFRLPYTLPFDLRDPTTYLIPDGYDPDKPPQPTQPTLEDSSAASPHSDSVVASSSSGEEPSTAEYSAEEQPNDDLATEDIPSVHSVHSTPPTSEAQQPQPAQSSFQPSSQPEQSAPAASTPGEVITMLQHLTTIVLSNQMDLQALKVHSAQVLSAVEQLKADIHTAYDRLAGIDCAIFQLTHFQRYGVWPTVSDILSSSATPSAAPRVPLATPSSHRSTPRSIHSRPAQ